MDDIEARYDDFSVYSKSKETWYHSACHLMGAAGTLWASQNEQRSKELVNELGLHPEFSMVHALWKPYLMLCGMSLELLFKAIVVAKAEKPNTESHNLRTLASSAGVKLTANQEGQLDILSRYITWAGRYPVPREKYAEDYERLYELEHEYLLHTRKVSDHTFEVLPGTQLDWEHFYRLWKLAEMVYRQHE